MPESTSRYDGLTSQHSTDRPDLIRQLFTDLATRLSPIVNSLGDLHLRSLLHSCQLVGFVEPDFLAALAKAKHDRYVVAALSSIHGWLTP